MSYENPIGEFHAQFDLLISQYAGLASIDKDYKLISTVHKARGINRLSHTSLEKYFIPKKDVMVTKELLFKTKEGVGYTKTAPLYGFQRVS